MSVRGIFHFIRRKTVAVFTDYPKVFTGLPDNLRASSAELWNVRSLRNGTDAGAWGYRRPVLR